MAQLIITDKDRCNLSLTCIRVCPAKAIKISDNHAKIIPSRCIGCGSCVTVCAQDAISFRDEIDVVRDLLVSGDRVAAICDPAIASEFVDITDYRKFVGMLRALGFELVTEMSFGVDLVGFKYKKMYEQFQGKYYISANCPPVASYVQRYHPELVDNIAPIVPPFIAMSKVVHEKYGPDVKVVYFSGCVAAKDDCRAFHKTDGRIDAVLTFVELRKLFAEKGISEKSVTYSELDPPLGRKGALYPVNRGFVQSVDMNQDLLSSRMIIAEGRTNFIQSISEFEHEKELKQHLDLFYCKGCVMGPGTSSGGKKFFRRSRIIKFVNQRLAGFDNQAWEKEIEVFSKLDLSRGFKKMDKRLPYPTEQEIHRVLVDMGKSKDEDQLGCGACGYPTCREFAVAHCQGLTNFEMCYTYTIKQLHTYIEKVNSANLKLKLTKEALKKSEEKARVDEQAVREAAETTTSMLNKLRAGVVIVDENLKILESNHKFVTMLGDDARTIDEMIPGLKGAELNSLVPFHKLFSSVLKSGQDVPNRDVRFENAIFNISVFVIKKGKIVGGIVRDLTAPEVRKDEVIDRARAVIRENLETVQQIAFLLGESASKTEKILTSIIDSQKLGDSDENTRG